MSATFTLSIETPADWKIAGELTMHSLSRAWRKLSKQRPTQGVWNVDLQGVEKMDTAGLAVLLDMTRYAAKQQLALKIRHLPKAVRPLMEAQGVGVLLEKVTLGEK